MTATTAPVRSLVTAPMRRRWPIIVTVAAILAIWELAGQIGVASGALPGPSQIAAAWWRTRGEYPAHILSTLGVSAAGFVLGNAVAIGLAILYQLVPVTERLLRTTTVVLFCMPIVVAAPILGIALPGSWPQIVLSALLVFFPTLLATHLGLREASGDAVEVVRASGGGALRQLRLVRLRAAVPDMLAGMQIAAPAAVLGAMLGEFLGSRHGLGIYLIGSMGQGLPAVVWAIGLTATLLSTALYGLVGLVRILAGIERARPTLDLTSGRSRTKRRPMASTIVSIGWGLGGIVVLLALWEAFIAATGLPRILMNGPQEVISRLLTGPAAAATQELVWQGLLVSLQPALLGGAAGIVTSLVLAVIFSTFRDVGRVAMPIAFLTQTVPIVALAPLLALLMGRGFATTVAVTVSVTFFPSLVTIMEGIARAPTGPLDVLRSVNASRWVVLTRVTLPNAVPHVLASVRLAVPRALTGVLIAEQYVTGAGLGGLLGEARGSLDYGLMWVITVVVAAASLLAYGIAQTLESTVLRRRS